MNTINSVNNNVSFCGRHINMDKMEKLPPRVYNAILKNPSIESFIEEGKPKTFIGKLLDIFKKDEVLDINYVETKVKLPTKLIPKDRQSDPYSKACNLTFIFRERNGSIKKAPMSTEQQGIERQLGSIPKPNEHYRFKPPVIKAEDKLAEKIESIQDFKSILR